MLEIEVPGFEYYNEETNLFEESAPVKLQLEHSLVSLSKWESKWEKPFLGSTPKSSLETVDYIRCMSLSGPIEQGVLLRLTDSNIEEVNKYTSSKMTATWFTERNPAKNDSTVVTAELVYYWMISLNIPFECQDWHLNRLLTLIKVCSEKNAPQKKMSSREIAQRNRELNEKRRKEMNTRG